MDFRHFFEPAIALVLLGLIHYIAKVCLKMMNAIKSVILLRIGKKMTNQPLYPIQQYYLKHYRE